MAVEYLAKDLEKSRLALQRLYFLLTEPETDEIYKQSRRQFERVYSEIIDLLRRFLQTEFGMVTKNTQQLFRAGFEKRIYNGPTLNRLLTMAEEKTEDDRALYERLRDEYVFLLRMIHDMLSRMGEEPEETET